MPTVPERPGQSRNCWSRPLPRTDRCLVRDILPFTLVYPGRRQPTLVGGARQDNVFARNLRARIDNGLYVRTLKDLRNVHEQSRA